MAMLKDGRELRFARQGVDHVVSFVELHELEARAAPQIRDLPNLVQLFPSGNTRDVDVIKLWTEADETTLRDLVAVRRLQTGEATELYYMDRRNQSTGRIIVARID